MNTISDFKKGILYCILFIIFQIALIRVASGQNNDFERWAPMAKVIHFCTGIPASVQLAQAFNETNFGRADTIGKMYNNVFAIMDFENDYWVFHSAPALGCWGRHTYQWRVYFHPIISWIDHAIFMRVHNAHLIGKSWKQWMSAKYSGWNKYWGRIEDIILKYKLYKYDSICSI